MSHQCQFPFGNLQIDSDGLAPCCWSAKLIKLSDAEDFSYNSKEFRLVREQLNSGNFPPACAPCKLTEGDGKVSLRQRLGQRLFPESINWKSEKQQIKILDITLDRVCPLACRMCSTVHSTTWDPFFERLKEQKHRFSDLAWKQISDNQLNTTKKDQTLMTRQPGFWTVIERGLETCKAVNMTGGEPLVHPDHNRLIKRFGESQVSHLIYHTSFNVPEKKVEKLIPQWKEFESVTFKVSVDDINEDYERFRLGGDFKKVLKNLEAVRRLHNVQLEINVVVQSWNVKTLPEILLFWTNFPEVSVNLKPVNGPELFRTTVLPLSEREPIVKQLQKVLAEMDLSSINQSVIRSEIEGLKTEDHSQFYNDLKIYNEILDENVR